MKDSIQVTFLGTNGSCSYNNGLRTRFGTNTPCVTVFAGGNVFVFDAGSGICGLNSFEGNRFRLFLSHYHVDHLNGLLFFNMLFNPENEIDIIGFNDPQNMLKGFFEKPYSPVGLDDFEAKINYKSIEVGDIIDVDGAVRVSTIKLSHPGGSMGYRLEYGRKSICYFTDVELYNHSDDTDLIKFANGTDLLITDSSFSDENIIRGWGHSSPEECALFAKHINAGKLVLYHYDRNMSDCDIEDLENSAKKIFSNSIASYDGLKMEI